jgi:hypothetical protein
MQLLNQYFIKQQPELFGLVDKAPDFGSEDCRFKSFHGWFLSFGQITSIYEENQILWIQGFEDQDLSIPTAAHFFSPDLGIAGSSPVMVNSNAFF